MAEDSDKLEGDEGEENETSLLPKSFFRGKDLEIGKTCKVKIEGIYEDEVEISYVPHKKDKDGKDKDSDDDDDDKPRRRRDRDDSDLMRESLSQMEMMAPPPTMGGY